MSVVEPPGARAFAPAHVTGIFRPALAARDPRARGSLGAGIVLELGVTARAEWIARGPRRVLVRSDVHRPLPISTEVARRLFPARNGTLRVSLIHDLPIGQGFGLSAAGATATALSVAALFDLERRPALEIAHLSDLFGGGGLGGVAAIASGGGLEVRSRPGLPPRGRVRHLPLPGTVFLGLVGGPLPSPPILRSPAAIRRIEAAASGLPSLIARPTVARFFSESERFTDRAGLAPPALRRLLADLRARDTWAAQAMFGRTFVARPRSRRARVRVIDLLRRRGLTAVEVRAADRGARAVFAAPESE